MKLSKIIHNEDSIVLSHAEKAKFNYVSEIKEMLKTRQWDWFLTLTFKYSVKDQIKVSKAIERFINNLSRKAFGTRSNKRVASFSVIEYGKYEDSLHVHMIIEDPQLNNNSKRAKQFNLRDAVIESWLQASSSAGNPALSATNDEWIKRIENVNHAIDYMTKQIDPTFKSIENPVAWDQLCLDGRRARP